MHCLPTVAPAVNGSWEMARLRPIDRSRFGSLHLVHSQCRMLARAFLTALRAFLLLAGAIVQTLDAVDFAAGPKPPAIATPEALHMILLDGAKAFDRSDRGLLIRLVAKYCGLEIPCRDAEGVDEERFCGRGS